MTLPQTLSATLGVPQLTLDLLTEALVTSRGRPPAPNDLNLDVLHDYAHDNQIGTNGQYWRGRKPVSGSITDILDQLVSDDQIGPALDTLVAGQLDRDPEWDVVVEGTPIEGNAEGVFPPPVPELTEWHQGAQLFNALRDAARAYQWAGRLLGRVYIPDVYRDLIVPGKTWTLQEALSVVHVQAVDPRQGGPLVDGHGRVLGYYFAYSVTDPRTRLTTNLVELHTPDRVWTLTVQNGAFAPLNASEEPPLNPFGSLNAASPRRPEFLMWHADRDGGSAITPSIRAKQDRLNAAATNAGRNDDMAGYRQIIVANAEQPVDKDGKPVPWTTGPAVAIRLVGIPYDDEVNGVAMPRRHTPTWNVIDPVDPAKFQGSIDMWTRLIARAFDQEWRIDPQAAVSGESKRVSRKGHDKRVAFAAQDSGAFLAWALRAAYVLASTLVGKQQLTTALKTTFTPRLYLDVDSTNLSEYRELLTAWRDGGLDLQTLVEATPTVKDSAAVVQRIKDEWKERGGAPALGSTTPPTTGTPPAVPQGDA